MQELQEDVDAGRRGGGPASPAAGGPGFSLSGPDGSKHAPEDASLGASSQQLDQQLLLQPTPYNTLARPNAAAAADAPTPTNTLVQGGGVAAQPSPRGNLLEYVASVLSRRNTTEVSGGGGGQRLGAVPSQDPVQAMMAGQLAPQVRVSQHAARQRATEKSWVSVRG